MPIVGNYMYVATLVMSLAIGYQDPELFYIFVGTLRASGYAGDVVLVVGEHVPSVARKFCEAHNVTLQPRAMLKMANSSTSHGLMHPQLQRFAIYPNLCQPRYDACLATDFRDVYFQADPFATLQAAPDGTSGWLVGSIEHTETDVATDVVNAYWVSVCYGRGSRELKAMRKKPVVCSVVSSMAMRRRFLRSRMGMRTRRAARRAMASTKADPRAIAAQTPPRDCEHHSAAPGRR